MKKIHYSLLLAVALSLSVGYAQDAKFKALFMYNFTKYIEWPPTQKNGSFVIEVLGNSPIIAELEIIAQKRKVGTQAIHVKRIQSLTETSGPNILFIPENKSSLVNQAVSKYQNMGTIIITDKNGMIASGAGINYVKVDGKQNFEVSRNNIESQGLKVNSGLLSLGISKD
ncbi:MAG: DUF4154 domain-containing protein [Bacteroidetes bacterium]|jgi:hypothetical protein|nr:DUF4154 domain-containing protein [Bacteroidota bacterium]